VDIPPKFMSFVFYVPEGSVSTDEEKSNATVMYDDKLQPFQHAKYKANSVCIFVPHFCSYHGFASTTPRDVLVMFLVQGQALSRWAAARKRDQPPFSTFLDAIETKLQAYPLLEYGMDGRVLTIERDPLLSG
jgi:hypothetical protein